MAWATTSKIHIKEINALEINLLSAMEYNLFVTREQWVRWSGDLARFWNASERIAVHEAGIQGCKMRSVRPAAANGFLVNVDEMSGKRLCSDESHPGTQKKQQ